MADLKEPEQYARVMGIAEKAEKWSGGEYIIEVAA